ncbi:chaperonin 10-like protein [Phyllosticta citrichinensis]|uniref:Chaperonin 10-like protein n=1 Tax=Phyllosticta citrichinensis TaxID=1130410 RepID=A0ABR1XN09_9PEZI
MTAPQNKAAWLIGPKEKPFKVADAPLPSPDAGEVLIKNAAVAINPVDWKIQELGVFIQKYPNILGGDFAGVVEDVGAGVTRFKKGQRVISFSAVFQTGKPELSAFQHYACGLEALTAPIPDALPFVNAVVLPLAISTVAAALYFPDHLALPLPTVSPPPPQSGAKKQTILTWGGASSVGSVAIQLAKASGLHVLTTASARNAAYARSLGADAMFDYAGADVEAAVAAAIQKAADVEGAPFVGALDSISSPDTLRTIARVVAKAGLPPITKVAATQQPPEGLEGSIVVTPVFAMTIGLPKNADIAVAIWGRFVPEALAAGVLQAKPDPLVVGHGLESIQKGLDVQWQGVSAKKVVVTL